MNLKEESIPKITKAMITEAIITTTALLCNSGQVGQVTLLNNSSLTSDKYVLIFSIIIQILLLDIKSITML